MRKRVGSTSAGPSKKNLSKEDEEEGTSKRRKVETLKVNLTGKMGATRYHKAAAPVAIG
jgi:hypothetical protein